MAGNQVAYGEINAKPASVPCHYAPVVPWRWFRSTAEKNEIGGKIRTEKWLQYATLGSPGGNLIEWKLYFSTSYRPLNKCFTWFGCLFAKIVFFWLWPPKDAKTKRSFLGVSRHFCMFKVPTKLDGGKPSFRYGPNGPGNQFPGRSASILTKTASRGRYSIKFRSTCTVDFLFRNHFFCIVNLRPGM